MNRNVMKLDTMDDVKRYVSMMISYIEKLQDTYRKMDESMRPMFSDSYMKNSGVLAEYRALMEGLENGKIDMTSRVVPDKRGVVEDEGKQ